MDCSRAKYADFLKNILVDNVSLSEIKDSIPAAQRNFFNMLFLTLFRQLTFIKYDVFPKFINKKIPHKHQILEFILYLGITELLFLDTPDYAVLHSYTDVAKSKTDKFGGNFVNAVLRNVLRNKIAIIENRKKKFFSTDFIKILKQDYSINEINKMELLAQIEPPLDLTFKHNAAPEFNNFIVLETGSIRLPAHTKVNLLEGFNEGRFWVQDAAAALAVKCLFDIKGKKVLDLCAAPGGKTAQLLDAGAIVTAVDISKKRLEKLQANIDRLNLGDNLSIICCDALEFQSDEKFDIIVVDAPCSATGTYRRHPEIMNLKTLDDVKTQAILQNRILNHIHSFLKPGGLLLYVTCSLAKIEGEQQIQNFLEKNSNFEILPISLRGTEKMQTKEGFLRILPYHFDAFLGIDGFFIALLKRKI